MNHNKQYYRQGDEHHRMEGLVLLMKCHKIQERPSVFTQFVFPEEKIDRGVDGRHQVDDRDAGLFVFLSRRFDQQGNAAVFLDHLNDVGNAVAGIGDGG